MAANLGAEARKRRIAAFLKLTDTSIGKVQSGVEKGTVEVRLSDIPPLMKTAELLVGEATSRLESVPPGFAEWLSVAVTKLLERIARAESGEQDQAGEFLRVDLPELKERLALPPGDLQDGKESEE
jgi:hypothetical protein